MGEYGSKTTRSTRTAFGTVAVLTLGLSLQTLSAQQTTPVPAPPNQAATPPTVANPSEEGVSLVDLVDEYVELGIGPRDFALTLRADFFKTGALRTYAPYTVTFDASALDATSMMLYVRLVERGVAAAQPDGTAAQPGPPAAGATASTLAPAVAFEDLVLVDVAAPESGGPIRISRALAVNPGDYVVYLALREQGKTEGAKSSILQQTLTVPDFSADTLSTSSVMLVERMGTRPAALTPAEQLRRPYTIGTMEIVPAWRSTYATTDTLTTLFIIYGPANAADTNRPNVTVDYDFYQRSDGSETYFNRAPRQTFDAETLPIGFDLALGHQLVAERSVSLQAFPAGDYRIDIRVTDRVSGQSLGHEVFFSVQAP